MVRKIFGTLYVLGAAAAWVGIGPGILHLIHPSALSLGIAQKAEAAAKEDVKDALVQAKTTVQETVEKIDNAKAGEDEIHADLKNIKREAAQMQKLRDVWRNRFGELRKTGDDTFAEWRSTIEKIPELRYKIMEDQRYARNFQLWQEGLNSTESVMNDLDHALDRYASVELVFQSLEYEARTRGLIEALGVLSNTAHERANSFLSSAELVLAKIDREDKLTQVASK